MSNRFIAPAVATPTTITSGQTVDITLRYEYQPIDPADLDPEVHMSCSPTFEMSSAAAVTLTPSTNGSVTFTVTLTRARPGSPDDCTMIFNALHDERRVAVTVTR